VPVDNFYEWKKLGPKEKQPYAIGLEGGGLMALAGLWETWRSRVNNETIRSFTIVTTTANALCADLHNRMPVILPPETWSTWLGETEAVEPAEAVPADQLKSMLVPYTGEVVAWPVSQRVGNVKNNDASLIEPILA
jgi:putative SOS response-associated peptidase YedK